MHTPRIALTINLSFSDRDDRAASPSIFLRCNTCLLFFLSCDKFINFLQLVLHVISSHSIVHGCCWCWSLQWANSLAFNVRACAVYQRYPPIEWWLKSLFRASRSHLFGVKVGQWIRSRESMHGLANDGNAPSSSVCVRVCASVSVRVCILWNKMNFPFFYYYFFWGK